MKEKTITCSKKTDLKNFGDMELIDFGITCSKYSLETKDWRFLNLALKIWTQRMSAEKFILRQVDICLNVLKYLMNIVIVSQKPIQSLNLIYLLGGIDVFHQQ